MCMECVFIILLLIYLNAFALKHTGHSCSFTIINKDMEVSHFYILLNNHIFKYYKHIRLISP